MTLIYAVLCLFYALLRLFHACLCSCLTPYQLCLFDLLKIPIKDIGSQMILLRIIKNIHRIRIL